VDGLINAEETAWRRQMLFAEVEDEERTWRRSPQENDVALG
jgi:hypothetical protein